MHIPWLDVRRNGQCVDQPAQVEPFCQKIRIKSYPTYEYLGLIIAYLGEGEPPPRPIFKEFEGEGILPINPPPPLLPCNYYKQIENNGDMHVSFLHAETLQIKGAANEFEQSVGENDWGLTWYDRRPGWETRMTHFLMPNGNQDKRDPLKRSAKEWTEALQWVVPVDDDHHLRFEIRREYAVGEEVPPLLKNAEIWFENRVRVCEVGDAILQGKMRLDEVKDPTRNIVQIQDYLAMMGQGSLFDSIPEHLGRSDKVLDMRKKLWEMELLALANGKPLKKWKRPDWLEVSNDRI